MKSFANLVSKRMNEEALSLRRVAAEIGLDPSFFSKVLAGKRSPPSDEKVLTKLARCLKMDPILLIVSTGAIPSLLQTAMENPEFLERIRKHSFPRVSAARPDSKAMPRFVRRPPVRSNDLSEDLL